MAVYRISDEIIINAPIAQVWAFFSNPLNLEKITPPEMKLKYLFQPEEESVYPGMLLAYKVSPVAGIPVEWITEITAVDHEKRFVDEQRKGPFAMWHHIHEFESLGENKTLARDLVYYRIPLGILGRIAHGLFVGRQVKEMFVHRRSSLSGIFTLE
jgi:ligand-binding SRPBCC domain-containing protein